MKNNKEECLLIAVKDFMSFSSHEIYSPNEAYITFLNKLQEEYSSIKTKYILTGIPDREVSEKSFLNPQFNSDKTRQYGYDEILRIINSYNYVEKDVYVLIITDSLSQLYTRNVHNTLPEEILEKARLVGYIEYSNKYNCTELKRNIIESVCPNIFCPQENSQFSLYHQITNLNLNEYSTYLEKVAQNDIVRIEKHESVVAIRRKGKQIIVETRDRGAFNYEWPDDIPYDESKCFAKAYTQYIKLCLDDLMARATSF